jgi:iron complex outermembrane receptor protein
VPAVGGFGTAPLSQTPQSISVLRNEQLRDEGAISWSQLLRSEPSVGNFYNTTGFIESLQVRGFLLDSRLNYRRDGLPVSNYQPLALENKASVEILRGLSGIQAGSSSPGGLVNSTLKRPTVQPLREAFVGVSERGSWLTQFDIGGRSRDERFGYRVNAALEERRPFARQAQGDRQFISGFFDMRLRPGSVVEAEFEWNRSRAFSVPGISLFDVNGDGVGEVVPAVPSPRLNLGAQPWSQPFESTGLTGSIGLRQALTTQWSWSARVGMQRIRTNDRLAFPDGCSTASTYVYPGFCANGDADLYDYRSNNERRTVQSAELGLRGELMTGPVRHELGISLLNTQYRERFEFQQAYNFIGTTNVFNPVVLPPDPTPSGLNTNLDMRSTELAIFDVMRLNPRWSLWLGVRHSRLDRASARTDGSQETRLEQSFTTPWASLGAQLDPKQFVYLAVGQGTESEVVPNRPSIYDNFGTVLPALRSTQVEVGYRRTLDRAGLLSATLFEINKPLADDRTLSSGLLERVADARNQRHRGLELSWLGWLSRDFSLQAQATLLDAVTTEALDPLLVGKRTPNTSRFTAAATLNWQLPETPGVVWSNRVSGFSAKPVTRDNSVEIPGAAQWDSWVSWRTRVNGRPMVIRAGIDNVLDRRYWRDAPTQSWGGVYLFAAPPRTYRLSAQFSF